MLYDLYRAFGQLQDPRTRGVVWLGLGGALALMAATIAAMVWLLRSTAVVDLGWLDLIIDVLGGAAAVVLAFLFFPGLVTGVSGLFVERVADAVEARDYPGLAPARSPGLAETLGNASRFLALVLVLNAVALVFVYLIPGVNLIVFYALNGFLLGREYFELVALRRLDLAEMRARRRAHGPRIFAAGVIIAVLATIPVVNLLIPVVATAFMVHVERRLAALETA